MYTLEEILNMPYNENRLFAMYHGETYEEFCSLVYIDEDGILRYEIDDNSKEENGKVYGNVVPIHNETLDYKFQVVYKFIPFIEAFNQWYFNNKIICCKCLDTSILRYDHEQQRHSYNFFPEDMAESKWYIEDEDEDVLENEGNDNECTED